MTRHPIKANKLRDVNPIRSDTGNIIVQKWKINNVGIKIIAFVYILDESKTGASVSEVLALFNCNLTNYSFKIRIVNIQMVVQISRR